MNPDQFEFPEYIKWKNVGPRLNKRQVDIPQVGVVDLGDLDLQEILGVNLNNVQNINNNRQRWADYINANALATRDLLRNVIGTDNI